MTPVEESDDSGEGSVFSLLFSISPPFVFSFLLLLDHFPSLPPLPFTLYKHDPSRLTSTPSGECIKAIGSFI